jgi:hypothetical protein
MRKLRGDAHFGEEVGGIKYQVEMSNTQWQLFGTYAFEPHQHKDSIYVTDIDEIT